MLYFHIIFLYHFAFAILFRFIVFYFYFVIFFPSDVIAFLYFSTFVFTRATIATHAIVLANHYLRMYRVYIQNIVPLTQIPIVLYS